MPLSGLHNILFAILSPEIEGVLLEVLLSFISYFTLYA
jgi:hypothetical protein